jgi:hypothetical protein
MDEIAISAELRFLESLKERLFEALKRYDNRVAFSGVDEFNEIAKALLNEYNQEYSYINELIGLDVHIGLQPIPLPPPEEYYSRFTYAEKFSSVLFSLIPQIDKGIEGLRSKISLLSPKEAQELKGLREDLQKVLMGLPEEYERNIEETIRELEKGCFLGSALISGRIIQNIFEQIPGGNIQEKIKALKDKGLVAEKNETPPEYIMKADKKARNYISHNLNAFSDRSDALELLVICNRLLKLLKAFRLN